eukprot:2139602-Amphidinium_carterae.1
MQCKMYTGKAMLRPPGDTNAAQAVTLHHSKYMQGGAVLKNNPILLNFLIGKKKSTATKGIFFQNG